MTSLLGMFVAAFLAATLVPAQSEAVLVALVLAGDHDIPVLWLMATAGNVLGSVVNWVIGRFFVQITVGETASGAERRLARAREWYGRYGWWSLLLSWLPLVGDALTLVAGAMREPIGRFVLLVTLAKGGRYVVLILLTRPFA